MDPKLDAFTRAYLETALWATTDNADESGGEPLDKNYDIYSFTVKSLREAARECRDFRAYAAEHISAALAAGADDEQMGHDFFLTRNRHGAGYWDGDYPQAIGTALTEAAHTFGTAEPYMYRGRLYWHS